MILPLRRGLTFIMCEAFASDLLYGMAHVVYFNTRHSKLGISPCRGRKTRKRGYRRRPRRFSTVLGKLDLPVRVAECLHCGAFYSPLLNELKVGRYARKEIKFEHEVTEAVIDTNYRRLIDISLGGIHDLVVDSDVDQAYQEFVP